VSSFVAIPVGQGDAFYFKSKDTSVLVDGGRSRQRFSELFRTTLNVNRVDIVVCTHNDADHANGILGFLEAGLQCRELWLPGSWGGVLPYLLKPAAAFRKQLREWVTQVQPIPLIDQLERDIDEGGTPGPQPVLERIAEEFSPEQMQSKDSVGPVELGPDGWPPEWYAILEREDAGPMFGRDDIIWLLDWAVAGREDGRRRLLLEAIEAATRIRNIARVAFHRGIRVRWFEHAATPARTGNVSALQPLNSRELPTIFVVGADVAFFYFVLTVANRQSLTFWAPRCEHHPGVLFTADSDLRGIKLPDDLDGAIVTSPHHGSEANAAAYGRVERMNGNVASTLSWVRSDGRFRNRPGQTYLSTKGRRLCTLCRNPGGSPKRTVKLFARGGRWCRHPVTAPCQCRPDAT